MDRIEVEIPGIEGDLQITFYTEGDAEKAFKYFKSRGVKVTLVKFTETRFEA